MEAGAAAPAAGSATATPSPKQNGTAGAQTPTPKAAAKDAKDAKSGAPQGKLDGKFVSRDSGTARKEASTEGEKEEVPDEKPKEYRFKRKLKDGDREEEVDLSEEDVAREVSIARAAKRRMGELNKRLKDLDDREARLAAAEKDPLSYLKERGGDPEQLAAKLLAEKAKRGLMSPEEQRISELEAENQQFKSEREKHEQHQAEERQRALELKQWEQEEPRYLAEMEKVKLPRDMATLGLMSKVGAEIARALGPDGATPEIVVRETHERLSKYAEHYVLSLPVEALVERLGPERTKAIQQHLVDKWRARQAEVDPVPRAEPSQKRREEPTDQPKQYLSEAEIRRRVDERYK